MKLRLFALMTLALSSTPLAAAIYEYRALMQNSDIGHYRVERNGQTASVSFDIKQNGRGPTISETILLDEDDTPLAWTITGRTTFGNAVDERFERTAAGVTWRDLSGPGSISGEDAPRYYVAQNGSPFDVSLLAKALLAKPDRRLPVAPSGTATLTEQDRRHFDGPDGELEVITYELSGLSLSPTYITLDANGDLFAMPDPRVIVARKGYEVQADRPLRDLVERLGSERLARLQEEGANRYSGPVRIRNVRVFDPKTKALGAASDVVVFGDRIAQILPTGSIASEGETTVDGDGGTLVPGLYEMHAHLGMEGALLNVLAGVTSVRDMGNQDDVLDQLVRRIDSGQVAGPRVTRSGFIEGKSPFSSAIGSVVASEEEAIAAIRWYAARGFHQAKFYNSMNPEWAPVVVAEAHRQGLRVAGHIPAFSNADAMIAAGFNEITHVNQLMLGWVIDQDEDTRTLFRFTAMRRFPGIDLQSAKVRATLDAMVEKRVAHEPTIGIHEHGLTSIDGEPSPGALDYIDHMPPAEQRQMKQALFGADTPEERAEYVAAFGKIMEVLSEMHHRGILLIPGTDTGGAFTYHRELELFAMLGMTPAEVLARATLEMAQFLGQDQQLGSIERGKLADFFLVPGDPTADLKAIKSIAMVVKDGVFYFPADIYPTLGIKPFTAAPRVDP
jgi:hypothetical protein